MGMAIAEAKKGLGRTSPNPIVGAVIVKDNKVVGRGYHHKAGEPHAEVNAIADAREKARGGIIYVTLEPCNHSGRTPPCTKAIVAAGIKKVVIGSMDPNPSVVGGGVDFLQSQNISVKIGVLKEQCEELIRPFVKLVTTGFPWIIMKAGMSLDGKISYQSGHGGKITGEESRQHTHLLRDRIDAILVGIETALVDNPSLTARLPGIKTRDPLRVILDTNLRLPSDSKLLQQKSSARTIIFCGAGASESAMNDLLKNGALVHRIDQEKDGRLNLKQVLKQLGQLNIMTVLVEGGAGIHGSFLEQNLVDEIYLYIAPFFIGHGGSPLITGYYRQIRSEAVDLIGLKVKQLGDDILINGLIRS